MNRREFLQCAAVLVAGAGTVPSAWAMNREQSAFLAARPSYVKQQELTFFSVSQRSAVAAIAEQIIPETDTPGAAEAEVGQFVELMVADWFDDSERQFFMAGLAELESRAVGGFSNLSDAEQLALLEQVEDEVSDAPWFDLGSTLRVWDDSAPFICQLKELVVLGYFLSEVGAKQALQINPMGSFKGDIPLVDAASYAAEMPLRASFGEG